MLLLLQEGKFGRVEWVMAAAAGVVVGEGGGGVTKCPVHHRWVMMVVGTVEAHLDWRAHELAVRLVLLLLQRAAVLLQGERRHRRWREAMGVGGGRGVKASHAWDDLLVPARLGGGGPRRVVGRWGRMHLLPSPAPKMQVGGVGVAGSGGSPKCARLVQPKGGR